MIISHPPGARPSRFAGRHAFDDSPLLVFYEVTRACDLVCLHCRACAESQPHPAELTPAESRRLLEQIADFPEPPQVVLTGGDPLKRPDIYELIAYGTALGLNVAITPSATPLVTREAVGRLARAGVTRMAISLDGHDAASHDAVRGVSGSFDHSLRILRWARECSLPTQVNTTVTPGNHQQLAAMAALLETLGITMWSVFFLIPVGRATGAARLTSAQYEGVFEFLWQQAKQRSYQIKTTEAPHYRRFVIQHQLPESRRRTARPSMYVPFGVNDGKGVMFVSHTGWIHPSGFLPITCGLFPLNHVVDVYRNSPVFRALRDADRLQGKCGVCEFRTLCGGSRARAYAVTGNYLAQEPDCDYQPRGWRPEPATHARP